MKTLFLFRDSYDAQYILSELAKKNMVSTIVLEKGGTAKKAKLKRLFSKSSLLRYPIICIDLAALVFYSSITIKHMKKMLGEFYYPEEKVKLIVDDANEKICIDYIKKDKPDVIFVYGTALLKEDFLKTVTCPVFNIHSGILPYYRNVHSDFWAYMKKDYTNIGITIINLDSGIDSGDIVLQKKVKFFNNDSLTALKVKNLKLIPELVSEVLSQKDLNKIKFVKQDNNKKGFYPTPGFRDFIKFLLKRN